jgi:8-oxo-dGTP pyrophosphatase MutT (NUDIX family)
MPIPPYVRGLRDHIGHDLLMLPAASAILFNDAGQVLLGLRSDIEAWCPPGGIVDPGEQPATAAVREILEETGVHAEVERIVGTALLPFTYPNGDVCQFLDIWFRCRATSGEARVNDDESLEVAWFDPTALPALDEYTRTQITVALDEKASPWFAQPGAAYPGMGLA